MSKFKRHLKAGLLLVVAAAFALNCARSSKTQFAQNMENDAGKAAPTYEEWVALVGQDKTDQLYAGIGQDSLSLLAYGIGQSNMVQLINGIADGSKLVTLVGNDGIAGAGPGSATGLGAVVTIYLLKSVNTQMQANISSNLVAGGAAPTDQDTVTNLVNVINALSPLEIQQKLIELFGPSGFDLSRSLATPTSLTAVNQQLVVDRMSRVVAHVDSGAVACTKICQLLTGLAATDITGATGKLAVMMKFNLGSGMTIADKLVETIETTTNIDKLRAVISSTNVAPHTTIPGVTFANVSAKMMEIIDSVTDCTKMGYTINNVGNLDTLINLINNVQVPARMGQLINLSENNAPLWTGQVSPRETWGVPVKAAPFGTAGAGATITGNVVGGVLQSINVTVAGTNYLPGISLTFPGCLTQPTVHLQQSGGALTIGVSSASGPHYVVAGGANCSDGATQPATIVAPAAGNRTGMERLVSVINGLAPPSTYYKLLNMVDGVSDMNKMVQLIQDLNTVGDVYDLVNNMVGVAGSGCTTTDGYATVTIGGAGAGATATSFNVGGAVAYIRVTNGGAGYAVGTTTVSIPGCGGGIAYTPTIVGGVITQITVNANPMNNLTQVVELMAISNFARLQQVMDGQRIFDNTNEAQQTNAALTTTYLGKLRVLMTDLSQPLEGTLKVGDLLNGVTNTDKIIDLIWGVSVTTNLATVINGIFKESEVPGCSDGTAGTYVGPTTGPNALDTGTCENSGNGAFYGERDRAVRTLVYLVENVSSSAKLVTMIDNITPAKVIDLVNHTATYSQHADGTAHVYPRGGTNLDPDAGGKRLAKIVENTTTITQLVYVTNNVSSIIKMSKLVSFMDIGSLPILGSTNGTAKLAVLINAVTGANAYNPANFPGRGPAANTNATGMGKMVNVIEYVAGATDSAAMLQLKNLLNDVSDINKMADLINQTVNSSNIVGLLNGVIDPRNNTSTTSLVTLMNDLPRGEITKLVSLIGEIGNATGTAADTFPGADHVLIAQLMATYNSGTIASTSGVGVGIMSQLIGLLGVYECSGPSCTSTVGVRGGNGFTTAPTVNLAGLGSGAGATATAIIQANTGTVTRLVLSDEGRCTTAPTGVTISGGPGTGALATLVAGPHAQFVGEFKIKGVYLNNGGSGYVAPTVTFTGGTCATLPSATAEINGLAGISVTAGGTGYTAGFDIPNANITGGGGTSEDAHALVAGPINTLSTYNVASSGYTTGDICPIIGAGGSGATCTVVAGSPGGPLNSCSAISPGQGYIAGQVVTIGGAARAQAIVNGAGTITGFTIVNSGCGYASVPTVTVLTGANECSTAGTYTAVLSGGATGHLTGINVTTGGTGCPKNPTVVIGAAPYAVHADNGTAIVNTVTNGSVVAISLAPAADNLAQLLANTEKAPGSAAVNYRGTTTPNISAREAMVRLLYHGVRHTSTGYFTNFATNDIDLPGLGSAHLGQNVLSNLTSANSTMTVINMLNSDTTSMTDLVVLLGCGDAIEFATGASAGWSTASFKAFCGGHIPNLWTGP